ncbi:MAG: FadR/GntR family transcriptional regulator [Pseudomonadota bacterium]
MGKIGAAEIASTLRKDIRSGQLSLHERLPSERSLAERYGVARNTLRDALLRLETEKYVKTRPGSGTYVTFVNEDKIPQAIEVANPLELIDARFALEPHICRLCVIHGRRSSFERLEGLCLRMEASVNDPAAFSEADTEFHRALAETTGNNLLIWIIDQINSVRSMDEWTLMRGLTLEEGIISQYNKQHRMILEAISGREPEKAANFMKDHLETARLSLTRAVQT